MTFAGSRLMREQEAGERLGVSARTLQKWRVKGGGPRYRVIGRRAVRYDETDLAAFVAAGERASTSDPGPMPQAPIPPSPRGTKPAAAPVFTDDDIAAIAAQSIAEVEAGHRRPRSGTL